MREWFLIALFISLPFVGHVAAEEESDQFAEAGLSLVALRNDSLKQIFLKIKSTVFNNDI